MDLRQFEYVLAVADTLNFTRAAARCHLVLSGARVLLTGNTAMSLVSITANMTQVLDVILRQTPRYDTPWVVSLLVLLGLVALSISVLERRVRGVEVVS